MENPTKMDDLGVSPIYGHLYFMTLESPQQAVSLTWTRRELGLEMAGCILNFWVQQHRECRVIQKKERNRENRNIQTGQQKNKGGTNIKNRKIQVVCLYADVFTACFSGDSSSQFVFFGESLFDSVGVFFESTFSVPVGPPFNDSIASFSRHHGGSWCKGPLPAMQWPRHPDINVEVSINGGTQNGWFIREIPLKWMI